MTFDTHIDHIDPRWKEGRDYQLVCGLDVKRNMEERDATLNIQKSNRFIPWRWSRDEMGEIPVNPGDLCLFLDFDTNEWVLEEFMGTWWFEKSRRTMGCVNKVMSDEQKRQVSKVHKGKTLSEEQKKILSERAKANPGPGPNNPEWRQKISKANTGKKHSKETKQKMRLAKQSSSYHYTPEHCEKIGAGRRGKKHSEESKRKIAEAASNPSDEKRRKLSEAATHQHSLRRARERCRRMSLSDPQMPDFED